MAGPLWGLASGALSAAGSLAGRARAALPAPAPRPNPLAGWPVPANPVGQVRLDANGNGTAQVAPSGVDWVITSRSVSIGNDTGSGAIAREYLDAVSDARYLQGTYVGANDSSGRRQLVQPGQVLYCVWTGGPPGAVATFRVQVNQWPAGHGAAHLSE